MGEVERLFGGVDVVYGLCLNAAREGEALLFKRLDVLDEERSIVKSGRR